MVPAASHAQRQEGLQEHSQAHPHGHAHGHDLGHDHLHAHVHGPASPHPAQSAPWSILRMTVAARLTAALAVCAVLWVTVWLAMR
jgi:hypothetical protein